MVVHSFSVDAISRRLRTRVSLVEAGGLIAAVVTLVFLAYAQLDWPPGPDFTTLMRAGRGDVADYYYAYWLLPALEALIHLEYAQAYIVWGLLNIAAFWFAVRVFGPNRLFALWSYQLFAIVFYGQITGLLVGALALFWWGLSRRSWWLAGLGLTVMLTKYQFGLLGLAAVVLSTKLTWREWLRIGLWPAAATLVSLALYGLWPLDVLSRMATHPANIHFSVSIWRWVGVWGALAFLPLLLVPRRIDLQLVAWFAAGALGMPYFQQIDLLVLMAFPAGLVPAIGWLGFAQGWIGNAIVYYSWIIPATFLTWAVVQGIRERGSRAASATVRHPEPSKPSATPTGQ